MNDLKKRYFNWMRELVGDSSYGQLLSFLHEIPFDYILPMDENRYEDGIDLRYHFGYANQIDNRIIATELDGRPCSVLEMMVALANRLEESIMSNSEIGDRTGVWFWKMISNLGLTTFSDGHFDRDAVIFIVQRFLNREYKANGEGGLFVVDHPRKDLRTVEIWYQAMWYLNEIVD